MPKLKLDKDSLQGFFFNHTEKIVLVVVLLLLVLFIWGGSSLEGIEKSPKELASKVDAVAVKIEQPTWDNIKEEYTLSLDHVARKQVGDAVTAENYYRLDTPLIGGAPNSATPRQDPELFPVTDLQTTVVTGPLAFKIRPEWTDPFADLENMEQKKIEAPKKRPSRKKKKAGMYGSSEGGSSMMEGMFGDAAGEGDDAMYGSGMFGMDGMPGSTAAGPSVRADANKFPPDYRPATTSSTSSVMGISFHVVSVKALVPYQQQWDEFERAFKDAAEYRQARDIPRYLSFQAQRAEVPSDPNEPLKWGYIAWTERVVDRLPKMGWAGFPGEIADAKYLLPGVLTMPVPPMMMRDLRGLALHSKVPIQEEVKAKTNQRIGPELIDVEEASGVADIDELPVVPGARRPGTAAGSGMYGMGSGGGMGGMYDAEGMGDMGMGMEMGGGMGMAMGMNQQLVRGPQAEFLMVRFFDYIKPGKKYVYRIRVVLEDPNHPQNPQMQPQNRSLADTVRTRLAKVTAEEAKQTVEKKTPIRLYSVTTEWSEPSDPVSVDLVGETYAGGVTLPRMIDILRTDSSNTMQKTGYAVAADGEPTASVMSLNWNSKYAVDLPGIVDASRGSLLSKKINVDVINPVTLVYKTIPDYPLSSGELVVDLRGGEVLEAPKDDEQPLLAPGEVAVIDATGNLIVRNELDDWQIFDRYAPPPPIVVEPAPAAGEMFGEEGMEGMMDMEGMFGE